MTREYSQSEEAATRLYFHILRQRFETFAIGLDYRDGDMPGFAGVDVCDGAFFARMCAPNDFALGAIP